MTITAKFRVNYYVGAMLAQGGDLYFNGPKIVFSPTSALDRAMGATNVEIPFSSIRGVEYRALTRSFIIKTGERIHKFEGTQAKTVWELLETALKSNGVAPAAVAAKKDSSTAPQRPGAISCDRCGKSLQPGYSFCPYCGIAAKLTCLSCRRAIEENWVACAFCGWKLAAGKP